MMIDHIGMRVRDLGAARRFYEAVAPAIGLEVVDNTDSSFLIGRSKDEPLPFVWVGTDPPAFWTEAHRTSTAPIHLAFAAPDASSVDAFHRAGLAAGGRDNGAPGPRGPAEMGFYGAFLLDPDGNNVEAGWRDPSAAWNARG